MFRAKLLGSGGNMLLPNRELTSLLLNINGEQVLIDCGEGTQSACGKAKASYMNLSVICITHCHGDHVFGLLGLLSTMDSRRRASKIQEKRNITIIAPASCRDVILGMKRILALFTINLINLWIEPDSDGEEEFEFTHFKIKAFKICHSVECFGYRIEEKINDHLDREKALKCPFEQDAWKFLQAGHGILCNKEIYNISDLTEVKSHAIKIAYATDTVPCDAILRNVNGPDLAILEGMYLDDNDRATVFSTQHMTFVEAAEIAREAEASNLWLTHFSPTMQHPEDGLQLINDIFPGVVCGYCGLSFGGDDIVQKERKEGT